MSGPISLLPKTVGLVKSNSISLNTGRLCASRCAEIKLWAQKRNPACLIVIVCEFSFSFDGRLFIIETSIDSSTD